MAPYIAAYDLRQVLTEGAEVKLLEKHIEQACTQLLEWDGWRSFKMEQNFSERKMKRTGEAGMPDRLYIRYSYCAALLVPYRQAISEVLFVEYKLSGQNPRLDQLAWHEAERRRGALVLVVDSIESFREWYSASGLQRRNSYGFLRSNKLQ